MAPVRTSKGSASQASTSKTNSIEKRKAKYKPSKGADGPGKEGDTLPGVQKIKASLRQTRRLLAKVSPHVRVPGVGLT